VPKWRAIVFDLDDTLYPERDYVFSGFRAVATWAAEHLGIPQTTGTAELIGLYRSGVRGDTFDRWLADRGLSPAGLVPQLVQVYRDHNPSLRPFPGVPELLAALHASRQLGLVSDGYLTVQERKWTALGLAAFFDAVIFSDAWGRATWKPSPKPFEAALQQLAVAAQDVVYVADNPVKDFLGARQVGLATIRLRWPDGEYTQFQPSTPQHAPDFTVASLTDLQGLL